MIGQEPSYDPQMKLFIPLKFIGIRHFFSL